MSCSQNPHKTLPGTPPRLPPMTHEAQGLKGRLSGRSHDGLTRVVDSMESGGCRLVCGIWDQTKMCFIVTVRTRVEGERKVTTHASALCQAQGPPDTCLPDQNTSDPTGRPCAGDRVARHYEEATSKGVGTDCNLGRCLGVRVRHWATLEAGGGWGSPSLHLQSLTFPE